MSRIVPPIRVIRRSWLTRSKNTIKGSRRDFLRTAALLAGGATLTAIPGLFQRQLLAQSLPGDKKLLFIFQAGGNDGLNTVIPRGDPDYNAQTRPTLFIPENLALDSGNGFAQFHPRLQPFMELYNRSNLNGPDGPGNLAVLHRISYAGQSRSHFDSQQYWQNGVPGNPTLEEGLFYRHLAETQRLGPDQENLIAAALSSSQLLALKGEHPVPNFTRASQFNVVGGAAYTRKFLGRSPENFKSGVAEGFLGLYGDAPNGVSPTVPQSRARNGQDIGNDHRHLAASSVTRNTTTRGSD